jgi:glyoxylase-like metal-dependent hydrolase (beta-lactamase superfamily II)
MVEPVVTRVIDVMHLGRDRVICAYETDGLIVDPGPASCCEALIEGLGPVVPRALLLTHIHLDHAGASGVLCRRFPELEVYVHENGAPHLIDPSKLLASAERLYGEDLERLFGEVAPVPRERIRPLSGGELIEGFRVAYTPGHASHHVSYLHEDTGDAYVGDTAGVRIPPYEHTLAPTPPPDIDVEAWLDSLHLIASWNPRSLGLTHFGPVTGVEEQLHRVRRALVETADAAREGDEEQFIRKLDADARAHADPDAVERLFQAAPPEQMFLGLERYWRQKAAAAPSTPTEFG